MAAPMCGSARDQSHGSGDSAGSRRCKGLIGDDSILYGLHGGSSQKLEFRATDVGGADVE